MANKTKNKIYFTLLSPFKQRIIKYLREKNIAFDPYNDESIYYEFYRSIRPQNLEPAQNNIKTGEGVNIATDKPINNNVPAMTHPDYNKNLQNLDWKAVFNSIKSFFTLLANDIIKKVEKGEEVNETEKELVIKNDQLNKEMKKIDTTTTSKTKIPLLIGLGLGIYFLTKK